MSKLVTQTLGWIAALAACQVLAVANDAPSRPRLPIYRTPNHDAPKVRVDGQIRGTEDAALTLTVLAPERAGLTTKAQPTLYWFLSTTAKGQCELSITERDAVKPLLEARFEAAATGLQRVRLADYHVSLTEGVEYRWSVAIVLDRENRSRDIVASGVIKRVQPSATLQQRLKANPAAEAPYIFAEEGFWYDSLEALSEMVAHKPQDAKLREIRAVYFMQVGLPDAALHDLQSAGKTASSEKK